MRLLLFLAMAIGLILLWQDDKAKTAKLNDDQTQEDSAQQEAISDGQKIQLLTAQVAQLQAQVAQLSRPVAPGQTGAMQTGGMQPGQLQPSRPPPSWYQNELNGNTPSLLDPHGATKP